MMPGIDSMKYKFKLINGATLAELAIKYRTERA